MIEHCLGCELNPASCPAHAIAEVACTVRGRMPLVARDTLQTSGGGQRIEARLFILVPCWGCLFCNCQDLDKLPSMQAGLIMLRTWARGYIQLHQGEGLERMCSHLFCHSWLQRVDYITLAALCVFFFLKWTEPCLLLRRGMLLFRQVMGLGLINDLPSGRSRGWEAGSVC